MNTIDRPRPDPETWAVYRRAAQQHADRHYFAVMKEIRELKRLKRMGWAVYKRSTFPCIAEPLKRIQHHMAERREWLRYLRSLQPKNERSAA